VIPSFAGEHGWNPMAFNPEAGLMYIPTTYSSYPFVAEAGATMGNQLLSINVNKRPDGPAPELQGGGTYLMAWDPVQRRSVWEQRIAGTRAGVLATAGNLVFQSTGMVSFADQLTPEDAEAIRAYVVSLANAELQARAAPPPVPAAEVH
jgi:hypothetical protein